MANCIYNGVDLSDINAVWTDKETYPYAVIYRFSGGTYLQVSTVKRTYTSDGKLAFESAGYYCQSQCTTAWTALTDRRSADLTTRHTVVEIIWANHDILNEDGSVFLAASEPRPFSGVYIGVDGVAHKAKSIYIGVPTETGSELGSLDEGSIVYVNENGSPVEFYVACHNYESGLNGEGRTLLVRKESYPESKVWNSSNKNAYAMSTMDAWLNGEYKSLLDVGVQTAIGTTQFQYTVGNGDTDVETLNRSVFLLSATELGRSSNYANVEGSALPIADTLKIANQNGSAYPQWTRTPYKGSYTKVFDFNTYGTLVNNDCTVAYGARPCFTLPDTFTVLHNGQVTEEPITMKPLARKVVRAFVGIDDIARPVFDTGAVIDPDGSDDPNADTGVDEEFDENGKSIWDMTLYQYDGTILSRMPVKYRKYVRHCWNNFYDGDYANIAVWEFSDWIAVSFLMDDFRVTEYDPVTKEIKAVGWHTCGYHKPSGVWTSHDYTETESVGGNYIKNINVCSCQIEYDEQVIYPLGEPTTYNFLDFRGSYASLRNSDATGETKQFDTGEFPLYREYTRYTNISPHEQENHGDLYFSYIREVIPESDGAIVEITYMFPKLSSTCHSDVSVGYVELNFHAERSDLSLPKMTNVVFKNGSFSISDNTLVGPGEDGSAICSENRIFTSITDMNGIVTGFRLTGKLNGNLSGIIVSGGTQHPETSNTSSVIGIEYSSYDDLTIKITK